MLRSTTAVFQVNIYPNTIIGFEYEIQKYEICMNRISKLFYNFFNGPRLHLIFLLSPAKLIQNVCEKQVGSGSVLTKTTSFISSPDYPNPVIYYQHKKTVQCTTTIRMPVGYRIRLILIDLDLGYSYNEQSGTFHCMEQVEIHEQLDKELLTKLYCVAEVLWNGQELHVSYTHEVTLLFISGSDIPQRKRHRGFLIQYTSE